MQDVAPIGPAAEQGRRGRPLTRLLGYLPRGNTLDDASWQRRHRLLQGVLLLHLPLLALIGLYLGNTPATIGYALLAPAVSVALSQAVRHRRLAAFFTTGGLVFCSVALVVLTRGSIESHFHFFIIIGFIALYQDWVPFLWNVTVTVVSHGIGTVWLTDLIFNHPAAQANPWLWSFLHGVGVLLACVGMVIFWRITEDEQSEKEVFARRLVTADAEVGRRRFTADLLVNLARRNQSMLYRQLDIINQLEEKEQDPDALAELFRLDHLATRVRRNAESLLVLAGEQPPRTWSAPVALRDVVRAAIAETEDLDRVVFTVPDELAVAGHSVSDLTHLVAELTENAVRFSPPATSVTIRARTNPNEPGGNLLTVEDWGVGMPPADLEDANDLLAHPREVDLAASQRLGFHVVARLAARHGIRASVTATPGSGLTAVVALPASLFTPLSTPQQTGATRNVEATDPELRSGRAVRVPSQPPAPALESMPREAVDDGGWWAPDGEQGPHTAVPAAPVVAPGAPRRRPSPVARSADGTGAAASVRGLRRRVPQSHLAPELRQPLADTGPEPPVLGGAAAAALSRYQASRQAARTLVGDAGDGPGERGARA